jgi:hypothetical protein
MALPTIVAQTTNSGTGSNATCAIPSGALNGDVVLVFVANDAAALSGDGVAAGFGFASPSGGQMLFARSSIVPDANIAAFSLPVTTGQSGTITVSYISTLSGWAVICLLIRGASDVDVANVIGNNAEITSASSITVGGVTTTRPDCMAFYVVATDGTDMNPFTVPGGWTLLAEVEQAGSPTIYTTLAVGYKDMPTAGATGSVTISSTVPLSDGWIGRQFAIDTALTPLVIRETLNDSTGTPYANGTSVFAYNADGSLYRGTTVGSVSGYRYVDVASPAAGEVVLTFKPGFGTQKFLVRNPSVDSDGLVTGLITPA